jgi:UDP-N-acetylmuramoylalanine--D-glutamate ligase
MEIAQNVLVLGLGRTGQAVARVLGARGTRVRVADSRRAEELGPAWVPPKGAAIELRLGENGADLLDGMELVVPSPGVPADAPPLVAARQRGVPIHSEIEVAARLLHCPLIAITGTNGKSTTTSLVGLALARSGRRTFTGGNLGTPLIAAVEAPPEIAVAEVSSFQLEWVERFRPHVGCLLNLTPDHLDRHPSFAAYRDAKARLFAAQGVDDFAVVNRDDPAVRELAAGLGARTVSFGSAPIARGAFVGEGAVVLRLAEGVEERYALARTRLQGRHNLENILAAVTVARLAGATPEGVQAAIDTAEPLPHRQTEVARRRGVAWVDDSKATNVGAAAKSLESFSGSVILLAGGVDKGGGYELLVRAAAGKVRLGLLFGAARERIARALEAEGIAVAIVPTLEAAVAAAAATARVGDTVLLAPACASFDMFTDYAARGRAFAALVEGLG